MGNTVIFGGCGENIIAGGAYVALPRSGLGVSATSVGNSIVLTMVASGGYDIIIILFARPHTHGHTCNYINNIKTIYNTAGRSKFVCLFFLIIFLRVFYDGKG